jgi:hypothetical protein
VRRGVTRSDTAWEEEASFAIACAGAKMDIETIGIGAYDVQSTYFESEAPEPRVDVENLIA